MSVLHCTVKVVKPGTMKNGNPYQRLCLEKPDGSEEWMPNFTGKMVNVGDKLIAEIKEGRYSEAYGQQYLIDDFVLDGGDNGQGPAPTRPESTSKAVDRVEHTDTDTWHVKDINIAAQAAFKAIAANNNIWEDEKEIKQAAKIAVEISIFWDKKSRAYVAGADIDGMKRNLADEVQQAVSADSAEVAGPEHTSQPDDPGFDDDLPF